MLRCAKIGVVVVEVIFTYQTHIVILNTVICKLYFILFYFVFYLNDVRAGLLTQLRNISKALFDSL